MRAGEAFSKVNGTTVLHGPFAGLRYPAEAVQSRHNVPMLLGSYERELHAIMDSVLLDSYDLVVDVGCAEGYYAVGLALKGRFPVMAFDAEPRELSLCRTMARLNGVEDRIRFGSWCSAEILRNLTEGKRTFVLSDCEGFEPELFEQATVAALKHSDALVELHGEAYEPLLNRFSRTHDVRISMASPRLAEDYPELACLARRRSEQCPSTGLCSNAGYTQSRDGFRHCEVIADRSGPHHPSASIRQRGGTIVVRTPC